MDEANQNADATLERAVLTRSVGCLQCGYDLRGLSVAGPCPECGCEVWKTVQHVVDPASRLLPLMGNPRKVGNALVLLAFMLLVAALLVFVRPIALTIEVLRLPVLSPSVTIAAGVVVLAGLWPVAMLAPADASDESVRGDLWFMAAGHLVLGAAIVASAIAEKALEGGGMALALVVTIIRLVMVVGMVVVMVGLRRVLLVIGERSREFRTAQGGRQRIREMIAAIVGIGLGILVHFFATAMAGRSWSVTRTTRETVTAVGVVIITVCALMLVIGLAYVVVNAGWIRRSLRKPPPTLRELVESPGRGA